MSEPVMSESVMIDTLKANLLKIDGIDLLEADVASSGVHLDAFVSPDNIRALATLVREADFMIESVSAVDVTPEMMVLYHFCHPDEFLRVVARVLVDRNSPACPTISDIYPGADWHERETMDFFGIDFTDHPDKTPLILDEADGDLNPLLKDEKSLKELGAILPRMAKEEPPADNTAATGEVDA
jgi:NADH-quinone oxidoreductase subunit C